MFRSSFSDTGLDIGNGHRNVTQMYGLSDFFAVLFEDSSKIDLLMEATSHQCSEIYSKFLQLTSTLSLQDIQTTIGYQTKLILINVPANNAIGNTFTLSEPILGSRMIANRPFLPTLVLEEGVHYSISDDGKTLTLFTTLATLNFPSRLLSDGTTKQYALWFVDALVDEQLISNNYGTLLSLTPEISTDMFKSFVYGILYLYVNGPNLENLRKGLNLSLGIPLARGVETVLDIRKYLDSDEYLVTTDQNSYVIPYGLQPSVSIGDIVQLSQELAQWVEVKDYISDGDWWVNLQIPQSVVPYIPAGQDRTAHPGGYLDYIMSNYLRRHTFLVNVNVVNFKNIQSFAQLYDIIRKVKPTNTAPIYIWSVPIPDETLNLDDAGISPNRRMYWNAEDFTASRKAFRRDNSNGYIRDTPLFIRFNMSRDIAELTGNSPETNLTRQLDGGTTTGTIGIVRRMRTENEYEGANLAVHFARGNPTSPLRSNVAWLRDFTPPTQSGVNVQPFPLFKSGQRIVPLYAANWHYIQSIIIDPLKIPAVRSSKVELFKPNTNIGPNGVTKSDFLIDLQANFSTIFSRVEQGGYLGNFMPDTGLTTYTPLVTDIQPQDYIMINHILDNTFGVYWVTSSTAYTIPSAFVLDEADQFVVKVTSEPTRGMASQGFPYYQFRGASYQVSYNTNNDLQGINQAPINSSTSSDAVIVMNYSDANNPGTIMLRNGTQITVKKSI